MTQAFDWLDRFLYRSDEPSPPLLERWTQEEPPPSAQGEALREHLSFWLGSQRCAVAVERVREIVKVPELTEVPRAPANLLGVMSLRGEVLPVYDIKVPLRLAERPVVLAGPESTAWALPRSARVLVLRSEPGEAGVLVDGVEEVVQLPSPASGGEGELGWVRSGDQLYLSIDPDEVLT